MTTSAQTSQRIVRLTEDEFFDTFKPVKQPNCDPEHWGGAYLDTTGPDRDIVSDAGEGFVWTIVDTDDGLQIVEGFHLVNRHGYLVTEVPAEPNTSYEIRDPDAQGEGDED